MGMNARFYSVEEVRKDVFYINEAGLNSMYIVKGNHSALVIDTGTGIDDFAGVISYLIKVPYEVVLTHGHVDHAGGSKQFSKVYVHYKDKNMAKNISLNDRKKYAEKMIKVNTSQLSEEEVAQFPEYAGNTKYIPIKQGFSFDLGNKQIEVVEMPGHTSGSIGLMSSEDKILFSGDNVNPIQLLSTDEVTDRELVLKNWYLNACDVWRKSEKLSLICAGHGLLTKQQVEEILLCGEKGLNHIIRFERIKIHLFDLEFLNINNSYIACCNSNELII